MSGVPDHIGDGTDMTAPLRAEVPKWNDSNPGSVRVPVVCPCPSRNAALRVADADTLRWEARRDVLPRTRSWKYHSPSKIRDRP
ncbi:MAG: hypothetical protein JWM95_28 [Gemmatimonadetes bacterium]|nr:hypothetical protein [Gemmatimonadota bacterium]